MPTTFRSHRRAAAALTAATCLAALAIAAPAAADPVVSPEAGRYIVQLAGEPVAGYTGGEPGLTATAAEDGQRLDTDTTAVERYRDYLADLRADSLAAVPGADVIAEFDTVFNGFTADLTESEAVQLAGDKRVLNLWPDTEYTADTATTPEFLGLTGGSGVWQKQFGSVDHAGEGVIIGVIDSGFWPENPSFAALSEPRPDQAIIDAKWNGECVAGNETAAGRVTCNNKVIGARYYDEGVNYVADEYASPRDYHGHGSHVAATAAGNHGVDAGDLGTVSGMAPGARIAVYKACWRVGASGCSLRSSNGVAAIEDAVNDGVDVINYSISGSTNTTFDPVHLAYFNAAAAGIFVANSAGNSGPGASTVAHNTPWITTVAASSHDRAYQATVVLPDGTVATGAGRGAALPATEAVLSSEVGVDGANPVAVTQCHLGTLDEAKVDGRIVVCARGANDRVEKSLAVQQAGGPGMVMYNVDPAANDIAPDVHSVPTVHLTIAEAAPVLALLADSDGPELELTAGQRVTAKAPQMATFSSTGPAIAAGGDLLKPDITAPGVDVIAAVSPASADGENFASYQGTSMSSPHIAGLAALLIGANPQWSPMAVKSAMMTTAATLDNQGEPITRSGEKANPFNYGSGHVVPSRMFDPGLVYESDPLDWLRFGCGTGEVQGLGFDDLCDAYGPLDASDLNYPSIAMAGMAGKQTVPRTVTNVSNKTSVYFPIIESPAGTKVTLDKTSLTLRPGQSATFHLTVTRTTAEFDEYVFGSLTWQDLNGHKVRSPIVVEPTPIAVSASVTGSGSDGTQTVSGTSGFTGRLDVSASRLVAADVTDLELSNPTSTSFPTNNPRENDHAAAVSVTVPEGAEFARFATFAADVPDGTDLDVFVYEVDGDQLRLVGSSAAGGSDEAVTVTPGAEYRVFVDLYDSPGQRPVTVPFHAWILDDSGEKLTVSPTNQLAVTGVGFTISVGWSGLTEGRYLARLVFADNTATLATSELAVTV